MEGKNQIRNNVKTKSRKGLNVRGKKGWKCPDHGRVGKFTSLQHRLSDRWKLDWSWAEEEGRSTTSTRLESLCHFHYSRASGCRFMVLLYLVVTIMGLNLILGTAI